MATELARRNRCSSAREQPQPRQEPRPMHARPVSIATARRKTTTQRLIRLMATTHTDPWRTNEYVSTTSSRTPSEIGSNRVYPVHHQPGENPKTCSNDLGRSRTPASTLNDRLRFVNGTPSSKPWAQQGATSDGTSRNFAQRKTSGKSSWPFSIHEHSPHCESILGP